MSMLIDSYKNSKSITFVGAVNFNSPATTFSWPAGTQEGDTAIIIAGYGDLTNIISDSGYYRVHASPSYGDITSQQMQLWAKLSLSAANVATPPTVTTQGSGNRIVLVFRNVGSIIDRGTTQVGNGPTGSASLTVGSSLSTIISWFSTRDSTVGTATPPTGYIDRATSNYPSYYPLKAATKTNETTGTKSWTSISGGGYGCCVCFVELTVA